MSQLVPAAGLFCAEAKASPVLEHLKEAEALKPDVPAGADDCHDKNNHPVVAAVPETSFLSNHTGCVVGAGAPAHPELTPEERDSAALLSVPPRSSPKPTPTIGGTALAGALAATAAADPLVAHHGSPNQRTNWGSWPLGTEHQALLLTKFQVSSGQLSVPFARGAAVFTPDAIASSGTVSLHSASLDRSFAVDLRRYSSQPTQVFLVRLKLFFTATSTRGGDVLALAPGPTPGVAHAEIWHSEDPRAVAFKAYLKNGRPEGPVVGVAAVSMAAKTAVVRANPRAPATDGGEGQLRRASARLSRPAAGSSSASHTHTVSEEGDAAMSGGDGASSRMRKRGGVALAELSGPAAGLRENPKRRSRTTVAAEDPENAMVYGDMMSGSPQKRGGASVRRAVRRGTGGATAEFRPPRRAAGEGAEDVLHLQPRTTDRVLRSAAVEQERRRLRRKGHPERSPEGEPDLQGYAAALMALRT